MKAIDALLEDGIGINDLFWFLPLVFGIFITAFLIEYL